MKATKIIILGFLLLLYSGCSSEPSIDRNGKITLGFTVTDTMEALVGVPMESLKRGGDIEVLIYNFSQHNKYSFIHLTERNNAQRYFFRFKNEQLVKYGPM